VESEQNWHLDKRVPIALLLAILLQAGGWIWWAASLNSRVDTVEDSIVRLESRNEALNKSTQEQAVQLGRIEEQISGLREDIVSLLRTIERSGR
jgi:Tfp pilus assembly protein PilO